MFNLKTSNILYCKYTKYSTSCPLTDLSVASWESSQSHPGHVEQPDLPIVVRKSNDFLVHRHADPEQNKQRNGTTDRTSVISNDSVTCIHEMHQPHTVTVSVVTIIYFTCASHSSAGLQVTHTHLLTAESVRMVAMGDLMFFRSQTLTVRSSLPDTTLSPTVNTADVTVLQRTKNLFK